MILLKVTAIKSILLFLFITRGGAFFVGLESNSKAIKHQQHHMMQGTNTAAASISSSLISSLQGDPVPLDSLDKLTISCRTLLANNQLRNSRLNQQSVHQEYDLHWDQVKRDYFNPENGKPKSGEGYTSTSDYYCSLLIDFVLRVNHPYLCHLAPECSKVDRITMVETYFEGELESKYRQAIDLGYMNQCRARLWAYQQGGNNAYRCVNDSIIINNSGNDKEKTAVVTNKFEARNYKPTKQPVVVREPKNSVSNAPSNENVQMINNDKIPFWELASLRAVVGLFGLAVLIVGLVLVLRLMLELWPRRRRRGGGSTQLSSSSSTSSSSSFESRYRRKQQQFIKTPNKSSSSLSSPRSTPTTSASATSGASTATADPTESPASPSPSPAAIAAINGGV